MDGNNQWEWVGNGNGNKTRLNVGLGMGMGINHWEWEGMGLKKIFPFISNLFIYCNFYFVDLAGKSVSQLVFHGYVLRDHTFFELPNCNKFREDI